MSENIKIVPATCSQCGGTVEVDPTTTEAKCPFCGTTFIVDKAITNYNIQYASIEHVDNVNIDLNGSVTSVLDFVGKQMNESRAMRKELKKAEAEKDKMITQGFLKIFGIMCAAMMAFAVFAFGYYQVTGAGESEETVESEESIQSEESEYAEAFENDDADNWEF